MAKDVYDKLKAAGDIFKQYWVLALMILGAIGNVYQYNANEKTVEEPVLILEKKVVQNPQVIVHQFKCMVDMDNQAQKLDQQVKKFDNHVKAYNKVLKTYHP